MYIKFILFIILFCNIGNVWSALNCPIDFPSGPNGCHKGSNDIKTSFCATGANPSNVVSVLIGSCPAGFITMIASGSANIVNNKFLWNKCTKTVGAIDYFFGQVGNCVSPATSLGTQIMEFNNTFRYFIVTTCQGSINPQITGELNSVQTHSQQTLQYCQSDSGTIIHTDVFDFGQNECELGYKNYPTCDDDDECSINNGGCQHICQNIEGSFNCLCKQGYTLNGDKKGCTDIDECADGTADCSDINGCINTGGNFICTCPTAGFRLGSDLKTCVDIDECNENSDDCTHGCLNNIGSYTCTCPFGYVLATNISCVDIDECADGTSGCSHGCENNVGGFTCSCNPGYRLNGNGKTCEDINECAEGTAGCSQKCTNTPSSFTCSCNSGYLISPTDPKSCLDINECLSPMCSQYEECVNEVGSYSCVSKYIDHVITSVVPTTTNGGTASFFGKYGDTRNIASLLIGDKDCHVIYDSPTLINCTALPGTGQHSVNLTQNGKSYFINNFYNYKVEIKKCNNDCTSPQQGTCNTNTGSCECATGYTSFDCSVKTVDEQPKTNVTIGDGETNLSNQQTNFQVYFKLLSEIGINGQIIKSYPLKDKWSLNKTIEDQPTIFTFTQMLTDEIQNCQITSIIEQVEQDKEFTFAGITFTVEAGLIKFTIKISNYTYLSFLNTLRLDIISSVGELDNSIDKDECNLKDTEIKTDTQSTTFNYIKISKNSKQLSGRFVNYLLSDGRPTYFTTQSTANTSDDSITISLFLPHFTEYVTIDPDFSVLVNPDFKSSCNQDSNRKWVIPVAVVVSVVGAASLAIAGFIIYKKKSVSIKVGLAELKRFKS